MRLLVDIIFIAVALIIVVWKLSNRAEKKLKREDQPEDQVDQYEILLDSIKEQATQNIPVSKEYFSNPFINNPMWK